MWNASTGQCLHTATLEAAIISLSFHPSGRMLAMASSVYIYLWDYNVRTPVCTCTFVAPNRDVPRDSPLLYFLLKGLGRDESRRIQVRGFISRHSSRSSSTQRQHAAPFCCCRVGVASACITEVFFAGFPLHR